MKVNSVIEKLNGVAHSYHWDVNDKRVVATLGTNNRGNTQVLRGKIRSALEV